MTSVTQSGAGGQEAEVRVKKPRGMHSREHYSRIGKKGGAAVRELYPHEHFAQIGQKGGIATLILYGPEHFVEVGKKGGKAGTGQAKVRKSRKGAGA